MNWNLITSPQTVDEAIALSYQEKVVLFKHSTRCSISVAALNRIERDRGHFDGFKWYYLDLLAYRAASNYIAEKLAIEHESPQLLLVDHGKCVYHASHLSIRAADFPAL